jgi:hypothetical protein
MPVSDNILQIKNIFDSENKRLHDKENSINDVVDSKERLIQLNTNYIERNAQYQKMVIAIIIGLAIILIIKYISDYTPIPSNIFSLIIIIVLITVGIYCFNIYLVLINRDPMDYEKLNISPPKIMSPSQINDALNKSSKDFNLLSNLDLGLCAGSSCCSTGTKWDISGQVCIDEGTTNEPFEPLLKVNSNDFKHLYQTNGDLKNIKQIKQFSINEFDDYSSYK